MLFLTTEQHQEVLRRLLGLGRSYAGENIPFHSAGIEYTSLMLCFFLHNLTAAETLLRISSSFSNEWFPVTIGYAIARTMFEVDILGHYITKDPKDRSRKYIEFSAVLNKDRMDACQEHKNSKNPQWREAMTLLWDHQWGPRQFEIAAKFDAVAAKFTSKNRNGKEIVSRNWSGKTLRQMSTEVDHVEAYDIFYSELSSFTHVDVHLADRFLHKQPDGPLWSQRARFEDVGNVFRHAASFLTCYLELFGREFRTWSETDVQNCWSSS